MSSPNESPAPMGHEVERGISVAVHAISLATKVGQRLSNQLLKLFTFSAVGMLITTVSFPKDWPVLQKTEFHDLTDLRQKSFIVLTGTNQDRVEYRTFADRITKLLSRQGMLQASDASNADYWVVFTYGQLDPMVLQRKRPIYVDVGGGSSSFFGLVNVGHGFGTFSGTVTSPSHEIFAGYRTVETVYGGGHLRIELYDRKAFDRDQVRQRFDGRIIWACHDCLFYEVLSRGLEALLSDFPGENGKECELRLSGSGAIENHDRKVSTRISSDPTGAIIEVNGKVIGRTPLSYVFHQDGAHKFNDDTTVRAIPAEAAPGLVTQVHYFYDPNFPDLGESDPIPEELQFDMRNKVQPEKRKSHPFWKFRKSDK